MLGFEINTGKKLFPVSAGTLFISVHCTDERIMLCISGSSSTTLEFYTFYVEEFYIGDAVTIKESEIKQSIQPLSIRQKDRDELLKEYHCLMQELKEAGKI